MDCRTGANPDPLGTGINFGHCKKVRQSSDGSGHTTGELGGWFHHFTFAHTVSFLEQLASAICCSMCSQYSREQGNRLRIPKPGMNSVEKFSTKDLLRKPLGVWQYLIIYTKIGLKRCSAIKSTGCSGRPGFNATHPHGGSQPSVAPSQGIRCLLSSMGTRHSYPHRQNTDIHQHTPKQTNTEKHKTQQC